MNSIVQQLSLIGLVPVIKLNDPADAAPLGRALVEGGLPCAEITFRTACAPQAIAAMRAACPDLLVGAGTVLSCDQVDRALAAGAMFIVSPGLNPEVVRHCQAQGVPILPGCANPSDVELALSLGLDAVKFFPAEAMGGLPTIKALAGPFSDLCFMPTGGVNQKNINDYLAFPNVLACGGTWMVKDDLLAAKDFDRIRDLTAEAVATILGFELAHVGLNSPDEAAAQATADALCAIFGLAKKEGASSIFAGSGVEVMKTMFAGRCGHIGFATNSLPRAIYHLERRGVAFDADSAKYDGAGRIKAIYLKQEVGGFALHLVEK